MDGYTILQDSPAEYIAIAVGYLALAPLLGLILLLDRRLQHIAIFVILLINSIDPEFVSTSLFVMKGYRGHSRGFEFSLVDIVALALIFAAFLHRPSRFKWLPNGYPYYLLYCILASFSLLNAFAMLPAGMAVLKFFKASLVFLAAWHYYQRESDLLVIARSMALVLLLQFVAVLDQRYHIGTHRVYGGFVHSNVLAMWCYIAALPMLAIGLARKTRWLDSGLILAAFGVAGVMIVMTVTRASLAAYGLGGVTVLALTFLTKPNLKRYAAIALLGLASVPAILVSVDTVIERIQDAGIDTKEGGSRYILNQQSKRMWSDYKVAGLGWNNYGIASSRPYRQYSSIYEEWARQRYRLNDLREDMFTRIALTESLYWLALAETGLLGFVGLMLFMLVMTWWTLRNIYYQRGTLAAWFCAGLAVVLLLLFPHGLIERILMQGQVLATLLVYFGIVCKIDWGERLESPSVITNLARALFYATKGRPAHVLGESDAPAATN